MKAYVGQTRKAALVGKLQRSGIGEMTVRGEGRPRRFPWVLDNGAFKDFTANGCVAGAIFDAPAFEASLAMAASCSVRPDFVVAPDVVCDAAATFEKSARWFDRCAAVGAPVYFVVQDGMAEADVEAELARGYGGIFVGGSLDWKLATSARWVALAHRLGLKCHIGRVGTAERVEWAASIGADSIDSALPLWTSAKMEAFLGALKASTPTGTQGELCLAPRRERRAA